MAQLLIVTTGLTGILNASLALADRLTAAGHGVVLAAPRPVGERVESEGFVFEELPFISTDPAPPLPAGLGKVGRIWWRFRQRRQRRRMALESYRPRAFRALLERLRPDLVLIDIELHEYIFAAYGMGQKFVLLSQWYSLWRQPGLPYLLTDVIPGQGGERGSPAGIAAHWERVRRQRQWMFRRMAWRSFGTDRRSVLLALAQETGFPLAYIKENWWPGVFSYANLPVLTMTPYEMEFPHVPRPGLHYVGPMVYAKRREAEAWSGRGRRCSDLLEEQAKSGRKVILCTISTLSGGDAAFLRRLVAAVADRRDWTLFLGLGGTFDPVALGELPEHVHTFTYVPQLRVLRRADLSINHGGIHTIHECLHFGVPMLVYSGKQSDQPGCAARVHSHGVGLLADKDVDDAGAIARNMAAVLEDPAYRQRVLAMRQSCQAYATSETLEKRVAEWLQMPTEQVIRP